MLVRETGMLKAISLPYPVVATGNSAMGEQEHGAMLFP